jgi:hypothetical protein
MAAAEEREKWQGVIAEIYTEQQKLQGVIADKDARIAELEALLKKNRQI